MHQQKETLHPLLERWISVMVALVGRLCYLGVNDKDTLRFVFRQFILGFGVFLMIMFVACLPLLFVYLHELINSPK